MIRLALLFFALTSLASQAQTLRLRTEGLRGMGVKAEESRWEAFVRYKVSSDFADQRTPRGYMNAIDSSVGYKFTEHWSVSTELGVNAETVGGQIEKGEEQAHSESVNPSTALSLDYGNKMFTQHTYQFGVHGEPLWDEGSRLEGYKGLVGGGAGITLNFFNKVYSMSHTIDGTSLINTFEHSASRGYNPDYFYTYSLTNALRFWGTLKLAYAFSVKATRYMDGFWGYTYQNSIGISRSFQKLTVGLAYSNGGFTDKGEVSMWYLDEYRRIASLRVSYAF